MTEEIHVDWRNFRKCIAERRRRGTKGKWVRKEIRNNHDQYPGSHHFSLTHPGNPSGLTMLIFCHTNLSPVLVHSFIEKTFIKHLLWARLCAVQ